MKTGKTNDVTAAFLKASSDPVKEPYELLLYVAGMTPRSLRSIANIKEICEQNLKGRYTLRIIDIYKQPEQAKGEVIIAVPTLLKKLPLPLRRLVGDLSDRQTVLLALNLRPKQ